MSFPLSHTLQCTINLPMNLITCFVVEHRATHMYMYRHTHTHTVPRMLLQCRQRLKLSFNIGIQWTQMAVNRSNVTIRYSQCIYKSYVFKLISDCTTHSCNHQSLMYLGFNCFSLWHNECQSVTMKHSFCIINHGIFIKGKDNYNKITVQNCLKSSSYLWHTVKKIIA